MEVRMSSAQGDTSNLLHSVAIYEPLDTDARQIRPVTVEAITKSGSDIKCRLEIVSLNDAPLYQALLYVWGDPNVTKPIFLNDTYFHVTVNLAAALHRLRDQDDDVVFWIDAICIDQSNLAERSSQVKLMGDIYSKAERVVAWLGKEESHSRVALALMNIISRDGGEVTDWSMISRLWGTCPELI
jgi:hypothetical protein